MTSQFSDPDYLADGKVLFLPDLIYSATNGRFPKLDLYLPQEGKRPFPVIIWLHGGGWRFGDKRLAPDLSRYFAQSGFAMVSIDYTLSGEATFPAPIYDVKAAIRWVRHHAEQYGFDTAHIGLWGSSAGAHLGSLVALAGATALEAPQAEYGEQSVEVQAVVDGYGPTDFLQMDAHRKPLPPEEEDPESVRLPPDKRTADADSFESLFIGAPIGDRPDLVQMANPVTYVKAGAPPFLIMHGLSDTAVPAHQSELLYEALVAHNNTATLYLVKNLGHGFLNRDNFDQPPRLATVKQKRKDTPEEVLENRPLTFDTIETFFKVHLMPKS